MQNFEQFFLPQNQSKGFKHAHAALKHHLNQTKIDIFFSAIFWDKLRGHFRMLKSQNISHALCAHFSWLRTARWDEKSGWWRCPKLDAKTLPNSQQPKRKTLKMFQKNKLFQLQILVVNWPVAQQLQPNGTKRIQWLFLRSKDLFTQSCSTCTQMLSHNGGLVSLRSSHSDSISIKCSHRMGAIEIKGPR